MKIVFFGTPSLSARILEYLSDQSSLSFLGIVTQPDKPRGRSQKILHSPVKSFATKKLPEIPIYQPQKASDPAFIEILSEKKPDFFVVVGYGQILRKSLLEVPSIAPINIHTSLLPKYRGAAPMQRCLMDGCKKTGVTIMKMDEGMDSGDILMTEEIAVSENMILGELEEKMIEISGPLLMKVLSKQGETLGGIKQDHKEATFAKKLDVEEFFISWNFSAEKIHNLVRALSPKPAAWCWVQLNGEKKRVKILRTLVSEKRMNPEETVQDKGKIFVGTKTFAIEVLELQLEGKKAMDTASFLNGFSGKFFF